MKLPGTVVTSEACHLGQYEAGQKLGQLGHGPWVTLMDAWKLMESLCIA